MAPADVGDLNPLDCTANVSMTPIGWMKPPAFRQALLRENLSTCWNGSRGQMAVTRLTFWE
jgi:hypothetical protein